MNNSSSSSSSPSTDKNSNHHNEHPTQDEKNANHILDVMFDYMANGDDELTLRFDQDHFQNQTVSMFFFSFFLFIDAAVN